MPALKLFSLAATGQGSGVHDRGRFTVANGFEVAVNADAARGAFLVKSMADNPDFRFDKPLCLEIPDHVMREALEASDGA